MAFGQEDWSYEDAFEAMKAELLETIAEYKKVGANPQVIQGLEIAYNLTKTAKARMLRT